MNQFCTSCVNCLCNDILLMHKTHIPSTFSVSLQLKDLISENMKISKPSQNCWQWWVCSTSFFAKTRTVAYCFYQIVESSIRVPAIYVNMKKTIENKFNDWVELNGTFYVSKSFNRLTCSLNDGDSHLGCSNIFSNSYTLPSCVIYRHLLDMIAVIAQTSS